MPTARRRSTAPARRSPGHTLGFTAAFLSIEGVGKEYFARGRRLVALDSINLDIAEGAFVTIAGPSGCGKSTMLNLIVGLLRAS